MDQFHMLWWHWVVLAGFLLVLEALGAGGFLLGFAVAGLFVAGLGAVVDLAWYVQVSVFSVLGAVLSFWYVKRFRGFNAQTDSPLLNHRMAQLIGRQGRVVELLSTGQYKIQVGDTLWRASGESGLDVGRRVTIIRLDGDRFEVVADSNSTGGEHVR
ncbi:MAG: NfeD family protein [Gammaproteobacteria bacterium]|nr:NfeD family protein [Gammaproteobacteria bacterium]